MSTMAASLYSFQASAFLAICSDSALAGSAASCPPWRPPCTPSRHPPSWPSARTRPWQGLQHHVHHGGLLVLLPGIRLLGHLLGLGLGPALDSVGLSLALQSYGLGLGFGFNDKFVLVSLSQLLQLELLSLGRLPDGALQLLLSPLDLLGLDSDLLAALYHPDLHVLLLDPLLRLGGLELIGQLGLGFGCEPQHRRQLSSARSLSWPW